MDAQSPTPTSPAPQGSAQKRIQFSSPCRFLGGPGMLSRTSWASWDLFRTTPLSFTAVCILRTFDWFLWGNTVTLHPDCEAGHQLGLDPTCPRHSAAQGWVKANPGSHGITAPKAPRDNRDGNRGDLLSS